MPAFILQYTSTSVPYPNDPDNKKQNLEQAKGSIVSKTEYTEEDTGTH